MKTNLVFLSDLFILALIEVVFSDFLNQIPSHEKREGMLLFGFID